jgi:hypothetical protein
MGEVEGAEKGSVRDRDSALPRSMSQTLLTPVRALAVEDGDGGGRAGKALVKRKACRVS